MHLLKKILCSFEIVEKVLLPSEPKATVPETDCVIVCAAKSITTVEFIPSWKSIFKSFWYGVIENGRDDAKSVLK